jgi:uncharacterized repeat protein (TIGR03843 family)
VPNQDEQILPILRDGTIQLAGEFVWGSNYTFLVQVELNGSSVAGVYKPTRGERPLWDFPRASLAHREVAAYLVSQALGWELVPPTVYRRDGPSGPGSLQLFIQHEPEYHYFNFSAEDRERLKPTVLFDYLINNADRKGSHLLVDEKNHIWLIDHGVCFHAEDKLRTVIWDFAGQPIPHSLAASIRHFQACLEEDERLLAGLKEHLAQSEIKMLSSRASWLSAQKNFPDPPAHRRATPWPPI